MSYTICAYPHWRSNKPPTIWHAKNGRQVVGLLKTIMDNFNPVHVDILLDGSQDNLINQKMDQLKEGIE